MKKEFAVLAVVLLMSPVVSAELIVNSENWKHHATGAAVAEIEEEEYYGVDEPGEASILAAKNLESPVVYRSSTPGFSGLAKKISSEKRSIPENWASNYADDRSLTRIKVSERFGYQAASAMPLVSKGFFPVFSGKAEVDWSENFRRPEELSAHIHKRYFNKSTAASIYDENQIAFDSLTLPRPALSPDMSAERLSKLGVKSAVFLSKDLLPQATDAEEAGIESVVQVGRTVAGADSTSVPPNAVEVPERNVNLELLEAFDSKNRTSVRVRNDGNAGGLVNISVASEDSRKPLYRDLLVPAGEVLTVPVESGPASARPVVTRHGKVLERSGDESPEAPPVAVSLTNNGLIASNPGTETTYLTVGEENGTRVLEVPPSTTKSYGVREPDFVAGSTGTRVAEDSTSPRAIILISVISLAILFGLLLWDQVNPRLLALRE